MKTTALISANLKRFLRNWRSILLLTGFPLLIVGIIFSSFSPDSLNVPIGTIDKTENFNYDQFEKSANEFAEISEYRKLEDCIKDLKTYRTYFCAVIDRKKNSKQYRMDLYYDNTREVIDRNILSGIKRIANEMQLDYSRKQVSKAIGEVRSLNQDISTARGQIKNTSSKIEDEQKEINKTMNELETVDEQLKAEVVNINDKIETLRDIRTDLNQEFDAMDEDMEEAEKDIQALNETRKEFHSPIAEKIESVKLSIQEVENSSDREIEPLKKAEKDVEEIESDLDSYNERMKKELNDANRVIKRYDAFREKSTTYIEEINRTIEDLEQTRQEISHYREKINQTEKELNQTHRELENYQSRLHRLDGNLKDMNKKYSKVAKLEPGEVAKFVDINNKQVYKPEKFGSNLIVLQTIFSTLVFLVALFVSILISMFVTLNEINSSARQRIEITPHTFLSEYLAIYITSLLLISIPLICVLAAGEYFFKLPIFSNIESVSLVILLFCSSLINIGISVSYLVREKSITLFMGSFLVVFLIFFSGFILPTEMMSTAPKMIATSMPGKLAQQIFDLKVLYGKSIMHRENSLLLLGGWTIFFFATGLMAKSRKSKT